MPNSVEPLDLSQYFLGSDSEVLIHPVMLTPSAPTPTQRALIGTSGTIAPGTTTLAVTTPTAGRLYDKQRIVLPNGQVIVVDASAQPLDTASGARFFAAGANSITIYPNIVAITRPATIPYEEFQPLWSVESFDYNSTGSTAGFKNFSSGPFKILRKTGIEGGLETNGFTTRTDPMLRLCQTVANQSVGWVKVRLIPPDHQGFEFNAEVLSDKRSGKVDEPYMAPLSFAISGVPRLINFTPS